VGEKHCPVATTILALIGISVGFATYRSYLNISTFDNSWNFLGVGKFCVAGSQRGSGENAMTAPETIIVWTILGLIGFVVALR
jgi:hypothetical protein